MRNDSAWLPRPDGPSVALGGRRYVQPLGAYPSAIGRARRIVRTRLREWGWADAGDAVEVCLTELLTNVAKHAGSVACVVTLEEVGDWVRLTVADTSTGLPVVRECDWSAESGRGMSLIAGLADSYGWAATGSGKDVWVRFNHRAAGVTS